MKTISRLSLLALSASVFFYGCKKDIIVKTAPQLPGKTTSTAAVPDSMVMTPQGLMLKSQVHLVESGYHLEIQGTHILKVKDGMSTAKLDLGVLKFDSPIANQPQAQAGGNVNTSSSFVVTQTNSTGWKTYAEWSAGTSPIGTFSSKWIVPAAPVTTTPQIIYIGDGVSSAKYTATGNPLVIQPILEYGNNGITGTGASWTVSSWCCWNGGAAYTTPHAVTATTLLQGVVTLTAQQTGGSYNYTSAFSGITGTTLTVVAGTTNTAGNTVTYPATIPLMSWGYETLQSYSLTAVGQYPAQTSVNMTNISLQTGLPGSFAYPASLGWTATTAAAATMGEHTNVISTNSSGTGEVDLWFHYAAPVISYSPSSKIFGTCGPITPLTPTNTGGAGVTWTVSPALPAGLSINASTGVISGTPTTASAATNYVITATNNGGVSHFTETITITGATTITYPATEVYHDGTAIAAVAPTVTGTTPTSYSISPSLATNTGLTFNTTTGVISGTPTIATAPTAYTITATNGTCTSNATINIATCFPFTVYNASDMGLSITFQIVGSGAEYGADVVPAHNTNFVFWLPLGNYYIVTNNAGSGIYHIDEDFTLGPDSGTITNGHTFTSVTLSPSNNFLYVTNRP